MKIGMVTVFPPERDGIADYSFNLIKSIENLSNDCIFYVMAPMLEERPQITVMNDRLVLFRIWNMKSLKAILNSMISLIRTIVTTKVEILHIQYRFTRDQGGTAGEPMFILMSLLKMLVRDLRIVISIHDFWFPTEAEQRVYEITRSRILSKLYRLYYAIYMRAVLNRPDVVVSVVDSIKSPVTNHIQTYTKKKVVSILHGVLHFDPHNICVGENADKTKFLEEIGVMSDKFTILLFGFIRRGKGYDYVVKALHKVLADHPEVRKDVQLLIVGIPSSPVERLYLEYLKELVQELSLDDVVSITEKYSNAQELTFLLDIADVTVISYTKRVGPSGVFSRALAYEVPSIITCDNKYATLGTDLPAIMVNLDSDEIATAIFKLISNPREFEMLVYRMRAYKKRCSNQNIARKHLELYRSL